MVYLAARSLGCSHNTIHARIKNSPEVKAVHESERGYVVDVAELKMYDAVIGGDPGMIKFVLQTLGKDRGYAERSEHVVKGDEEHPIIFTLKFGNINDDSDA